MGCHGEPSRTPGGGQGYEGRRMPRTGVVTLTGWEAGLWEFSSMDTQGKEHPRKTEANLQERIPKSDDMAVFTWGVTPFTILNRSKQDGSDGCRECQVFPALLQTKPHVTYVWGAKNVRNTTPVKFSLHHPEAHKATSVGGHVPWEQCQKTHNQLQISLVPCAIGYHP
jgi:hypothetical protein